MVRERVKERTFQYLRNIQKTNTKAKNIKYNKLIMSSYLQARNSMTIQEKSFAFSARTRLLDLKAYFRSSQMDTLCRKCLTEEESQEHLLSCPELRDGSLVTPDISYEDIFGEDTDRIATITRILKTKVDKLKRPSAPSVSAATI